jgi:hypothetical protein
MGAKRGSRRAGIPARTLAAKTVKRTLVLSIEASKRLDVHAAATGQGYGQVVDGLILLGLRRFTLTDRGEARGPRLAAPPEDGDVAAA